ncbi:MAG TPA: tetratricopeptide repeat protein [Terriglobales bacterium]
MQNLAMSGKAFRFGLFEADSERVSLSHRGTRIKIQEQPFRLLLLLLERPGEIVTREELRQKLWPEGTYVDFDGSLNVILKRLRAALDDDPEHPRFIETVPRRGYQFIAPVSVAEKVSDQQSPQPAPPRTAPDSPEQVVAAPYPAGSVSSGGRRHQHLTYAACAALVLAASAWLVWHYSSTARQGKNVAANRSVRVRKSVAVLGFHNLSGRAEDAWLATALSEMLSTELAGGEKLRLVSGEEVANLRSLSPWSQTDTLDPHTTGRIGNALNSDVLVLGSYLKVGASDHRQIRLDVRMQDDKTGEILTEVSEVGSEQDLFHLISVVGAKLRVHLGIQELQGAEEAGVLASLPLDPEVARFYSLGVAKLREFDALAAKDLLEQAAHADPKFSMVHSMLARAWAQLGYGQKRREEAKAALDLATDLPRAQRLLVEGEYYESLGKQEQAASAYHALFELFPDNVDYGLRLAAVYNLSGHGSQAMEVVHRLRSLPAPSSDDPRIDLTESRAMRDDKPVALSLVRSAMRKASDRGQRLLYADARKEECMILLYSEHPDQAHPSCEDAYNTLFAAGNRVSAADAVRLMADRMGTEGKYQEAIGTYKQALSLLEGLGEHEKTGAVLNNMAIDFADEGDLGRAEQLYRAAQVQFQDAGDPNNQSAAVGNIADILFLQGNLAGAQKLYEDALQIDASVDNSEPGYLFYRLADLNLTQGRVQDARKFAQRAIDSFRPIHGEYQYLSGAMIELGEALKAQGDLEGARLQFEQTLAMRQQIGALEIASESQVELADVALAQGNPERAEPLLRAALVEFEKEKADPDSSSAYTLLSQVLLKEGKLDQARKAAQRGNELSLTSSDPALKLPAQIQQARVDMASGDAHSANQGAAALRNLHSIIATAKRLGYYNIECEARLALGEWELKSNSSVGHKHLTALAAETRGHGLELLAREAESAVSNVTVLARNNSPR